MNHVGSILQMPAPKPSFLKIHKNGGSSIAHMLLYVQPGERRKTMGKKEWFRQRNRSLAVMWRHPGERLESGFRYLTRNDHLHPRGGGTTPVLTRGFKWFVMALCDTDACHLRFRDLHLVPQYYFAHYFPDQSEEDSPAAKFLPTLEFWWDWEGLAKAYREEWPRHNVSPVLDLDPWDDEMMEAHRTAYAWDWQKWEERRQVPEV